MLGRGERNRADTIPFNEVSKRGRFLQILFLFLNLISLMITETRRDECGERTNAMQTAVSR